MSEHMVLERHCCSCKKVITGKEDEHATVAFVGRGRYLDNLGGEIDDPDEYGIEEDQPVVVMNNTKFLRAICEACFLEDPDLCRFFNRIGLRSR